MKQCNFIVPAVVCPVQSTVPVAYPCIKICTTLQAYDLACLIFTNLVTIERLRYNQFPKGGLSNSRLGSEKIGNLSSRSCS